jgi:hypothetical protein
VVQQWAPNQGPAVGSPASTVFRNQRIDTVLTFYGPASGDIALVFRQGTAIANNLEMLGTIKLVGVDDRITTSEYIKGRWQRRVDVGVVLRRPVQFTYAQPVFAGAYGVIHSDAPDVPWKVEPPTP